MTSGSVDLVPSTYWQPAEGSQSLDLNGCSTGSISETFPTTSGKAYGLAFAYAGNPLGTPAIKAFNVTGGGATAASFTFDVTGHTTTSMGWTRGQVSFTASGGTTSIGFVSDTATCYGPTIDSVSLNGPGGPVLPFEHAGGGNAAELNSCMACAGDPIDLDTGAYVDHSDDLQIVGRGPALDFARTYDSGRTAISGRLGYGWADSYDWQLKTSPDGTVTIRQGNGSQTVFATSGAGYSAPPRVLATLVKNADGTYTYTIRRTTAYTFSSAGRLTAIRDVNGYTTALTYDASNRLSTVTDPAGRTLTMGYDTSNRVLTVKDQLPRTVTYTYDTAGNLATVTDADGRLWTLGYDTSHRLTTVKDPRGHTLTNAYNATSGVVTQQTDRRGKITTFAYSALAADGTYTTTVTHPRGNQDVYKYASSELISVTRGSGTAQASTQTRTYDPVTNGLATVVDGKGHSSSYSYDANGNRLSAADQLGHTTTWTYNTYNEPLTVKDPLGVTTTYTYDQAGAGPNLVSIARPLAGSTPLQTATTTNTYADAAHPGDITKVTDPNGKATTFGYDAYGDKSTVTDATGRTTTYTFNNAGWKTSMVSSAGNASGPSLMRPQGKVLLLEHRK